MVDLTFFLKIMISVLLSVMFHIDINECLLNIDRCADNCTNTIGSYSCSCGSGYRLRADGHTCEGLLNTVDSGC